MKELRARILRVERLIEMRRKEADLLQGALADAVRASQRAQEERQLAEEAWAGDVEIASRRGMGQCIGEHLIQRESVEQRRKYVDRMDAAYAKALVAELDARSHVAEAQKTIGKLEVWRESLLSVARVHEARKERAQADEFSANRHGQKK